MKIIGLTEHGYIVEVGKHEMGEVTGVPEPYSAYEKINHPVGKEIPINKAWGSLGPIIQNAESLKRNASTLRGLADVLDGTAELVKRSLDLTPATPV